MYFQRQTKIKSDRLAYVLIIFLPTLDILRTTQLQMGMKYNL